LGKIFAGDKAILPTYLEAASRTAVKASLALGILLAVCPEGHATTGPRHANARTQTRTALARRARPPASVPTLGDTVLAYAQKQRGRQVGDGECFALADYALSSAGAKSAAAFTEITPDGDYVWGAQVRLADIRPGDILQFRNFQIHRRVTTFTRESDGTITRTQYEQSEERDHHTAIVERVRGAELAVLEQNMDPGGRVVQSNRLAIAPGTTTEMNAAEGTQTITEYTVEGEVHAYRPRKASPAELAQATQVGTGAVRGWQ
jgi:hypothetical protein